MSDHLVLIERYFEGDLSEAELKVFQERLEADEAFAEAFQLEQDLMEGIEMIGNEHLKKELKGIYQEEIKVGKAESPATPTLPAKPRPLKSRRWFLVAAALATLLLALGWLLNRPSAEGLYAAYFQPSFDFQEKGNNSELIAKLDQLLKQKAYKEAIPLLDQLLKSEPDNAAFYLAKGIAFIATNKIEAGIAFLQKSKDINPIYRSEALWYNALASLKQKNIAETRRILQLIAKDSSRFREAQSLLAKIDQL